MGSFVLEDFLVYYPPLSDPNFHHFMATTKEFVENRVPMTEEKPEKQGDLLSQQKLVQVFLSPNTHNSKLLVAHKVGLGKCLLPDQKISFYFEDDTGKVRLWETTLEEAYRSMSGPIERKGKEMFKEVGQHAFSVLSCTKEGVRLVKVKNLFRMKIAEVVKTIRFEKGEITSTLAHHFLVKEKKTEWKNVIKAGDQLAFRKGEEITFRKVESVVYGWHEGWVYDLEVTHQDHNYFVPLKAGEPDEEVLSHNTCTGVIVGENFMNTVVNGSDRKPPLILVKNDSLMRQFITSIHSVCTKGKYGTEFMKDWIEQDLPTAVIEARLRKRVKRSYEISTFETFLKKLPDSKEFIRREYSNRVIIVDEVHKIREHDKKSDFYSRLLNFFTVVKNCRVMLMTGTPIWEKPWELSSLFNLLLSPERRLLSGNNFMKRYFKDGELRHVEELEDHWRGLVSFLRGVSTTAKKIEEGKSSPWLKHLKVYPSVMSKYQRKISMAAEKDKVVVKGKGTTREIEGGALLKDARDAMNFVFPEGKVKAYGKEPFNHYIVKKKRRVAKAVTGAKGTKTKTSSGEITTYSLPSDWAKELSDLKGLQKYSCKLATIMKEILDNPQESVFIYSENVTRAGAIMIGLVMELYGFAKVLNSFPIDKAEKRKRYTIFTSDSTTANDPRQIQDILKTFNDPRNRYGEYIQVIIGSELVSEGFTFKNVRQGHVFMPHWNPSSSEQALGRVLRFASHEVLPEEERYIKLYSHAAVVALDDPTETTDLYIYSFVEEKELANAQLYRLMKRISFDCPLTYERNVIPNDVAGSKDCDFQECNYECLTLPPSSKKGPVWKYDYPIENVSNYEVLYYYEDVYSILEGLRKLFRKDIVLNVYQILNRLKSLRQEKFKELSLHSLINALDVIVNARSLLKNRYGFDCYLKEDGGYYFLDETVEIRVHDYPLHVYTADPIVSSTETVAGLVESARLDKDKDLFCGFSEDPTVENFYKLHYPQRVLLIEFAHIYAHDLVSSGSKEKLPKAIKFLIKDQSDYLYTLKDGTVAHTMYLDEYLGQSYDVTVKKYTSKGLLRIFVPYPREEKGEKEKEKLEGGGSSFWVYANDSEKEEKYIEEIKEARLSKLDVLLNNEYGLYGILPQDGKFRIRKVQKRKGETKGLACVSMKPKERLEMFKALDFLPEPSDVYSDMTREEILDELESNKLYAKLKGVFPEEDLDDDELARLATYIISAESTAKNLCFLLMLKMSELGILFNEEGKVLKEDHIRAITQDLED